MKDPKRYTLVQINDEHWMHENKNRMNAAPVGEYVLFDDYARIKAEVERLRASSFVTAVPSVEYERLKAENERLQKAGDAMHVALLRLTSGTPNWDGKVYWDWNAAKDGKTAE